MTEPRRWSVATKGFFYAFLLTAPLNLYGIGSGSFNYRFSRLFLVFTVGSMLIDSGVQNRFALKRLQLYDAVLFTYLALALLSGIYVANYSAFFTRLFGLFECIAIFYVIRFQTSTFDSFREAVKIYLASSIFVTYAAYYQLASLWRSLDASSLPFPSFLLYGRYEEILDTAGAFGGVSENFMRISSTFGEPNMLGGYCASLLPLAIVMIWYQLERKKKNAALAYGILGLSIVITMIATVSKAAVACAATGTAAVMLLSFRHLSQKQKRVSVFALLTMCGAVVWYGLLARDLFTQRLELGDSGHLAYRIQALQTFLTRPMLGFGFGNYEFVSAHTLPLTAMLELGLGGGILVAILSITPLLTLAQGVGKKLGMLSRDHQLFYSACYGSYCSIFVGLYLYDYWIHPFTWVCIGLLMSMVGQARGAEPHVPLSRARMVPAM